MIIDVIETDKIVLDAILEHIKKFSLYVGIPEDTSERKSPKRKGEAESRVDEGMNNAQLLFIHTNGSPIKGLPARPVLEPAIEDPDNKKRINALMFDATLKGFKGDKAGFKSGMEKVGILAQNVARQWFVNPKNNWAPNKPSTIRRKLSRSKSRSAQEVLEEFYRRLETGESMEGLDRPLIDTAQMRKSITYVLEER